MNFLIRFLIRFLPWLQNDRTALPERNVVLSQQRDYLDLIPSDALLCVVKNLSASPHCGCWRKAVDPKDARTVIKCDGELSVLSRKMFTVIREGDFGLRSDRDFKLLVKEMAPYLQHIDLHNQGFRKVHSDELASLCSLRFDERSIHTKVLERILKAVGGRLIELSVSGDSLKKRTVQAITQCKSLKSLTIIHAFTTTSLEPLEDHLNGSARYFQEQYYHHRYLDRQKHRIPYNQRTYEAHV